MRLIESNWQTVQDLLFKTTREKDIDVAIMSELHRNRGYSIYVKV